MEGKLDLILQRLSETAAQQEKNNMATVTTLAQLKTEVEAGVTVEESAVTLLNGLSAQLKQAIANNDPAAIQAIADELDKGSADLSAAITANTPAA